MVSAPYCTAVRAFNNSSSILECSRDVPILALTLVEVYSPTATGDMCSRSIFIGMTTRPCATNEAIFSGLIPSHPAASFILGIKSLPFADSISVFFMLSSYLAI